VNKNKRRKGLHYVKEVGLGLGSVIVTVVYPL